jgi:hypothetical protein
MSFLIEADNKEQAKEQLSKYLELTVEESKYSQLFKR